MLLARPAGRGVQDEHAGRNWCWLPLSRAVALARGLRFSSGRWRRRALGFAPLAGEQRSAAQCDASQDGRAAGDLSRAGRVAEENGASRGADERLKVEERSGNLGGYPALAVGEEREGQQCAADGQPGGGQQCARAAGDGRHALGSHGHGQHGGSGRQELHGGHRDWVAAVQHSGLRHGERGRQQQRRHHQAIAADGRAASPAASDKADAGQ
jgi:hypothetical protein